MKDWVDKLRDTLRDSAVRPQAPLRPLTTLRIGGPAECLVELESEADLLALFDLIESAALPFLVLGKGSNVLVPDEGVKGVVIRLGKAFQRIDRQENLISTGAGCANGAFVEQCRKWGLGGMEFLIAVPGTIGGAIAMNAGAHDGETAQFLQAVRVFRAGEGIKTQDAAGIPFAYRTSPLRGQEGVLVLGGEFRLKNMDGQDIKHRIRTFQSYRRETQPRDFPNCGSIFKNPPGDFAARLIEEAGLKGKILGGAQVSEVHANFIVNRGGASSAEVLALVDLARKRVYSLNQVELELELQVL
ncbi:MAG: UDP-N-acetylmuramate dehydrogenase [SAR324 cluster bacterium]|nr:UDP-N-acetylmuramate dehydrogenase [SAR324 cluster bacterium]